MSPETADTIRYAADAVQWFALAVIVVVLALVLATGWRWPQWRRVLAFPLIYSALAVAFYVAVLLNMLPAPWTSLLSASLRLYVHILMLISGVAFVATRLAAEFKDDAGGDDGE